MNDDMHVMHAICHVNSSAYEYDGIAEVDKHAQAHMHREATQQVKAILSI